MRLFLWVLVLLACGPALAGPMLRPKIVVWHDADTANFDGLVVRMAGFDAPELAARNHRWKDQPGGREALAFVRDLTDGKELECELAGADHYGRVLVDCLLPDGTSLGEVVTGAGWASVDVRYSRRFCAQEAAARAARRGVWGFEGFTSPRQWRNPALVNVPTCETK